MQSIDVTTRIKERVAAEFVNLISDEQWKSFISKAIDEFTKDKEKDGRGCTLAAKIRSPLNAMIDEELNAAARPIVKDLVTPTVLWTIVRAIATAWIETAAASVSGSLLQELFILNCPSCGSPQAVRRGTGCRTNVQCRNCGTQLQ